MNFTAWLIVALAATAADDHVTAHTVLEPPEVPFHKQATFTIVVEAPGDVEVRLPDMAKKFGGLDIYAPPEMDRETLSDGRQRITESYILDPIFIGYYPIEPVTITWGDDHALTLASPGLSVRDLTEEERALAETFAPNEGPLLPRPSYAYLVWIAAIAAPLLVAAILLFLWRRNRGRVEEKAVVLPPWEKAYQRLRVLDERHLPEQGDFQRYYVELSSILRYYIEERFDLRAPEQTTPEFLHIAARAKVLSQAHQSLVAGLLRHCDRVKFAQYQPTQEQMEKSFTAVLTFVDETVPAPEAETVEEVA